MRIALIHSRYLSAEPSGENTVVDNEVAALTRAGHEVQLFERSSDDLGAEPLRRTRAAVRVATGHGARPSAALEEFGPDVVHVHNLFPNFGTSWLSKLDVPIVKTVHNYRAVCAAGLLYRDGSSCTDCLDKGRLSGLRHRCYRNSMLATAPLTIRQRSRLSDDPELRAAARIVVLSERTRARYVELGLDPARMTVWPNFVPGTAVAAASQCEREDFFLFVGRLREEKGILDLLRLWPAGRRLVVAGSGPAEDEARRLARSGVQLLGQIAATRVGSLLRRTAGLLIPSKLEEQFPMTYLEALVAGTPVIAFDTCAVSDLVRADGTGIVTSWDEPLDVHLLDAASRAPQFAAAAARVVEEHYSEQAYLRRAERLYDHVARLR